LIRIDLESSLPQEAWSISMDQIQTMSIVGVIFAVALVAWMLLSDPVVTP
jgi:hypothetical protein